MLEDFAGNVECFPRHHQIVREVRARETSEAATPRRLSRSRFEGQQAHSIEQRACEDRAFTGFKVGGHFPDEAN
jgi:hypothetical protein